MKKIILIAVLFLSLLLSACAPNLSNLRERNTGINTAINNPNTSSTSCEQGGLIYDNDEDPDWEIDLNGDCEGDIEFEGNENKTKHKPTDKIGVINKVNQTNTNIKKQTTEASINKPSTQVINKKPTTQKQAVNKSNTKKTYKINKPTNLKKKK